MAAAGLRMLNVGEMAQGYRAAHIGLKNRVHCVLEMPGFESHVDRVIGPGLSRLAQHAHVVIAVNQREMQVFDLIGRIDLVEGVLGVDGLIFLLVPAEVFHFCLQGKREPCELVRHLEFINRFTIFEEFEVRNLFLSADVLPVDGSNDEFHFFEDGERYRPAVHVERGPDEDLGFFVFHEGLSIHVDACNKLVSLGLVKE